MFRCYTVLVTIAIDHSGCIHSAVRRVQRAKDESGNRRRISEVDNLGGCAVIDSLRLANGLLTHNAFSACFKGWVPDKELHRSV